MGEHSAEKDARYMRLRGDGINVNRYRVNKQDTHVHLYLDVQGQHTLADLLTAVEQQGARPEDVTFRGGCFVITQPATPDDVAAWEQHDAEWDERRRESRRQQYERLRAEFEPEDTRPIPPGSTEVQP